MTGESTKQSFEGLQQANEKLSSDLVERNQKIAENTDLIEFLKEQIRDAIMEGRDHKINHGEEHDFHKLRKGDLRKHGAELERLKRKEQDLKLRVPTQSEFPSKKAVLKCLTFLLQLQREKELRKEEVERLEQNIGLKVAEAKAHPAHHAFPVPIPLHLC